MKETDPTEEEIEALYVEHREALYAEQREAGEKYEAEFMRKQKERERPLWWLFSGLLVLALLMVVLRPWEWR